MPGIDYEQLHIANNMPTRVWSLYKDLYEAMSEGRNKGVDDPAMRELQLHVFSRGPQIEVIDGDGHWRASRLRLRGDDPVLSGSGLLHMQIDIDKDAVAHLLSAMRDRDEAGGFVGVKYYNAILALPNVINLGDTETISVGQLVTPVPPRHSRIATFEFDHEAKLGLREALLRIEADPAKSPAEHRKHLIEQSSGTETS